MPSEANDHPGRAASSVTTETPAAGAPAGAPPAAPAAGSTGTTAAPVTTPATGTTAVPPQGRPVTLDDLPENALKPRLERERAAERAALFKELGVADEKELKAITAEVKERREKDKTAETKAAEANQKLTEAERRLQSHEETIKVYRDNEMKGLTEVQKKAVTDLAGDDAAAQLRAIAVLRPTWLTPVAQTSTGTESTSTTAAVPATAATSAPITVAATSAAPAGAPAVPVVPATTANPSGAPAPASTVPPDPKKEYERLSSPTGNPFLAAQYAQEHVKEVYGPR